MLSGGYLAGTDDLLHDLLELLHAPFLLVAVDAEVFLTPFHHNNVGGTLIDGIDEVDDVGVLAVLQCSHLSLDRRVVGIIVLVNDLDCISRGLLATSRPSDLRVP